MRSGFTFDLAMKSSAISRTTSSLAFQKSCCGKRFRRLRTGSPCGLVNEKDFERCTRFAPAPTAIKLGELARSPSALTGAGSRSGLSVVDRRVKRQLVSGARHLGKCNGADADPARIGAIPPCRERAPDWASGARGLELRDLRRSESVGRIPLSTNANRRRIVADVPVVAAAATERCNRKHRRRETD